MTPQQVVLVQQSFQAIQPISSTAGDMFYSILLTRNPDLRPLFSNADMTEQSSKLMAMLGTVVLSLKRPETILPAVRALGHRHRGYGAQDRHYEQVGNALIETLSNGLGTSFTPDVKAAWQAAYALLAGVMTDAPARPAAPS